MPPGPNDCNISSLVIKQPTTTLTVSRGGASEIEVTSEFGTAFPPVPCIVRVTIIDNTLGAIGIFDSSQEFVAPANNVVVSNFDITSFSNVAPSTGCQDVCTIYASLLPASNPPNVPDASFMILNFLLTP